MLDLVFHRKLYQRIRLVSYPESRHSYYKILARFGIDLLIALPHTRKTSRLVDRLTLLLEGGVE
jgi:hypothetical protein